MYISVCVIAYIIYVYMSNMVVTLRCVCVSERARVMLYIIKV